jgi:gas vesicle protein
MNSFRLQCRPLCYVLAAFVFSSSSCTNIQDDGTRTRVEGSLGGAALGAGLGAILGHQSGNAGAGALIGAAAGGLAGLAYGNHVANKKANYANEELWLNACIDQAQRANASARAYNTRLSTRIAELQRQVASGNAQQKKQAKVAIVQLQREANAELKKVDSEIRSQNSVIGQTNSSRTATLRSEVSSMQGTRNSLSSNIDRLASLGNSVDA